MKRNNSKKPHIKTEDIIILYNQGLSTSQIGEKLGLWKTAVGLRLKKAGIKLHSKEYWEGSRRYWLWKGDDYIDPVIRKYNQRRLRKWSLQVRTRDGHRCMDCGKTGVRLHAHHVIHIEDCIGSDIEFNPDNGITLCPKCHKHRHKEQGV